MSSQTNHHRSYTLSREQIPPVVIEELDEIERINLKEKIKKELVRQNAVIVSHYYTDADLQLLADETGGCVSDSLDMAISSESDTQPPVSSARSCKSASV